MAKRYRKITAKEGELKAKYGSLDDELDIYYAFKGDAQMGRDAKLLSNYFERNKGLFDKTLRQELIERGYDITTLSFSIMKFQ